MTTPVFRGKENSEVYAQKVTENKKLPSKTKVFNGKSWRRHPDLNWGIADLQSAALPLGYGALYKIRGQNEKPANLL